MGDVTSRVFSEPSLDRLEAIEFRFADGREPQRFRYADLEICDLLGNYHVIWLRFRCGAGEYAYVNVNGNNLAFPYEGIKAQRISWVAEAASWDVDDLKAPWVHTITVGYGPDVPGK
jgi:hypothetical protein